MVDRDTLLDAALPHVAFDGWSDETFAAACEDTGITLANGRAICPRGSVDLAASYHKRADATISAAVLGEMRYSERVAELVWRRIQAVDKEVVRRGMALFALPQHAAEGTALIWGTADAIWSALGDRSDDLNWYSKRAILSGVVSSSVLFWLGDASEGDTDTRAFIDRRIADVMRFEKFKGRVRENPALKPLTGLIGRIAAAVPAPKTGPVEGYPGWVKGK